MKELLGQDKSEFNVWFVPVQLDDAELSAAQFRVYAHLARRSNKGRAWPGIDSIASICVMHRETVIEAIKTLEKRGMIEVRRKSGSTNVYILTKQSSWVAPMLSTDQSDKPTSRKSGTRPVGNGERKVIQEGNLVPCVAVGDVVHIQADRIAAIFKRRKATPWSAKEVSAWKKLTNKGKRAFDEDELTMVERYYAEARKKADNYCRRDLFTFLNNYAGEVDRARSWCEKHPLPGFRRPTKTNPNIVLEPKLPPPDPEGEAKFLADFERVHHRLPYGYTREKGEIVKTNGATDERKN